MQIRLVSSLTAEDEARIAIALCSVVSGLLDQFGIVYTIRIETADGHIFNHTACPEPTAAERNVATT